MVSPRSLVVGVVSVLFMVGCEKEPEVVKEVKNPEAIYFGRAYSGLDDYVLGRLAFRGCAVFAKEGKPGVYVIFQWPFTRKPSREMTYDQTSFYDGHVEYRDGITLWAGSEFQETTATPEENLESVEWFMNQYCSDVDPSSIRGEPPHPALEFKLRPERKKNPQA